MSCSMETHGAIKLKNIQLFDKQATEELKKYPHCYPFYLTLELKIYITGNKLYSYSVIYYFCFKRLNADEYMFCTNRKNM